MVVELIADVIINYLISQKVYVVCATLSENI